MIKGRVHSIESFGTLDGPGIRTVVFMQGCSLNCKFCHNVDCLTNTTENVLSAAELVNKLLKNKSYWSNNGGVTFSGGEPLLQANFIADCAELLKTNNVNLTIDSSFFVRQDSITQLLKYIDYWMISFKHFDSKKHKELTSQSNERIKENILFLDKNLDQNIIRLRYLVIPTISDDNESVQGLIEFAKKLKHLDCIEVLAYGDHGKQKWIDTFGEYPFSKIKNATQDDIQQVATKLESSNIKVKL